MIYFFKEIYKAIKYKIKSSTPEDYTAEKEKLNTMKAEFSLYYDFRMRLLKELERLNMGDVSKVVIEVENTQEGLNMVDKLISDKQITSIYKIDRESEFVLGFSYKTI